MVNEETTKINVVRRWIADSPAYGLELTYETHFNIRLGRSVFKVNSDKASVKATGYSDILVKNGDRNLLIVEVKSPDVKLSAADRDQGISYARLVHPIAPYTLVTNGGNSHLYDTITKKEVSISDLNIDNIPLSLPDDLLFEAQRLFLRLDKNNLFKFCEKQTIKNLEPIKGSYKENKKYAPELYVERRDTLKAINEFIHSDSKSLIVTGNSGFGKTCVLAATVDRLIKNKTNCLFYNGSFISTDIAQEIANEYSWTFGDQNQSQIILKRLADISEGALLLVIVDAIDEWTNGSRTTLINSLIANVSCDNIKFIFSCKSNSLATFTKIRDLDTELSRNGRTHLLKNHKNFEFQRLIGTYKDFYGVTMTYKKDTYNVIKSNLFLLRILHELASTGTIFEFDINLTQVIQTYIEKIKVKSGDNFLSSQIIETIAMQLNSQNTNRAGFHKIIKELNIEPSNEILSELVDYGLLDIEKSSQGATTIGFSFEQVQNYIIAYELLELQNVPTQGLEEIARSATFPSFQGDVLKYYYSSCKLDHKAVFDGAARKAMSQFLDAYDRVIESNFPALRTSLSPKGDGHMGVVGALTLGTFSVGCYGFRRVTSVDQRIAFIPLDGSTKDIVHEIFMEGVSVVSSIISGNETVLHSDVSSVSSVVSLRDNVRDLINCADLNESKSQRLLEEKLLGMVFDNSEFRHLTKGSSSNKAQVIKLVDVQHHLLVARLEHYFEAIDAEKLQAENETPGSRSASFSYSRTPSFISTLSNRVSLAIREKDYPTEFATHIDLDNLTLRVNETIAHLQALGVDAVQRSHMYDELDRVFDRGSKKLSLSTIEQLVVQLHNDIRVHYIDLVEENFPAHHSILLSNDIEHSVAFELRIVENSGQFGNEVEVKYYTYLSDNGTQRTTAVDSGDVELDTRNWTIKINMNEYKLVSVGGPTSLDCFLEMGASSAYELDSLYLRRGVYGRLGSMQQNRLTGEFENMLVLPPK